MQKEEIMLKVKRPKNRASRDRAEFAAAAARIGYHYDQGIGTKQSYKTAIEWYKIAAKAGDAIAMYNLYMMYRDGTGVKRSVSTYLKWLKASANAGDAEAISDLGFVYFHGKDIKRNEKLGIELYKKAAKLGVARAHFNLGLAHLDFNTTAADQKAKSYFKAAAQLGHEKAKRKLRRLR